MIRIFPADASVTPQRWSTYIPAIVFLVVSFGQNVRGNIYFSRPECREVLEYFIQQQQTSEFLQQAVRIGVPAEHRDEYVNRQIRLRVFQSQRDYAGVDALVAEDIVRVYFRRLGNRTMPSSSEQDAAWQAGIRAYLEELGVDSSNENVIASIPAYLRTPPASPIVARLLARLAGRAERLATYRSFVSEELSRTPLDVSVRQFGDNQHGIALTEAERRFNDEYPPSESGGPLVSLVLTGSVIPSTDVLTTDANFRDRAVELSRSTTLPADIRDMISRHLDFVMTYSVPMDRPFREFILCVSVYERLRENRQN